MKVGSFGSALEEARYRELELLEYAGHIRGLRPHPRYVLFAESADGRGCKLPAIVYTADSEYVEDGQTIAEDVKAIRYSRGRTIKPTETQAVRLRFAVFKHKFPEIVLRVHYRESRRRG